jgi:DNA-directed RNA polymerase subunit alpha
MNDHMILLPSAVKTIKEDKLRGTYEIEGLYPGYGHTLGNSIRRVILSSLPGTAITAVKIDGASHEFTTLEGVKEDVIAIILNLKKVRLFTESEEPVTVSINVKGPKTVTTADIDLGGLVEVMNPGQYITEVTGTNTSFRAELTVQKGLGYVSKEDLHREKMPVGMIGLDAIFSPIRKVSYEVEDMRVGEKTNHNKLQLSIETDGSISPKEVLSQALLIMVSQIQAILDLKELEGLIPRVETNVPTPVEDEIEDEMVGTLKTRIDSLGLSTRTSNALHEANIRTVGGLVKKSEQELSDLQGLGEKALSEIDTALSALGLRLRQ